MVYIHLVSALYGCNLSKDIQNLTLIFGTIKRLYTSQFMNQCFKWFKQVKDEELRKPILQILSLKTKLEFETIENLRQQAKVGLTPTAQQSDSRPFVATPIEESSKEVLRLST